MRSLLLAAVAAASICLCPSDVTARPPRTALRAPPRLPRTSPARHLRWLRLSTSTQAQQQSVRPRSDPKGSFLQRVAELSRDPAHGNRITPNSRREGLIGAELEARGILPGPIRREPTGKSEFVDARGVSWDVKAFNSKYAPSRGGFELRKTLDKLLGEFKGGERVILDTKNLAKRHLALLRAEVSRRGWASNVLWFP